VLTVGFQALVGTIAFVHAISVKVQTLEDITPASALLGQLEFTGGPGI
jgi:hypothetical protein